MSTLEVNNGQTDRKNTMSTLEVNNGQTDTMSPPAVRRHNFY